jgi:prepilin-type N-terminal cleavage/methylation domain-containing protein
MKTNNKKAFSLMELLLVIAIMAIAAAASFPYVGDAHKTLNDGTAEQMTINLICLARSMGIAGRVKDSNISFKTDGTITVGSDSYKLPSNFTIKSEKDFKFGLDGKVTPPTDNFIIIKRDNYEKKIYVK